ncbi:MAG: hypothetical protein ACI4U5_00255 [Bacilli bacterium]
MLRKRLVQIIYRLVVVLIGGYFLIANSGIGDGTFTFRKIIYFPYFANTVYYVYFVLDFLYALVDYLCGTKESRSTVCLICKFSGALMVLFSFIFANAFLIDEYGSMFDAIYWENSKTFSYHFIMPILYLLDYWFLTDHEDIKKYYPFVAMAIPILYFSLIMARGGFLLQDPTYEGIIYPYDIIDVSVHGNALVIVRIILLLFVYSAGAALSYFWNRFITRIKTVYRAKRKALKDRKKS